MVTFVVEDGTMVPNANSYVTVEDATDYLSANIHASPAWVALTLSDQQALLIWATRYLDSRATWNGIPTSDFLANPTSFNVVGTWAVFPSPGDIPPQQALRWPRAGARDCDGVPIASNTIPRQLKAATAEMARYLIATDRSLERPQDGLTELKVDVITIKFREYELPIVPNEISYILRGLGTISSGRTNFSKITRV